MLQIVILYNRMPKIKNIDFRVGTATVIRVNNVERLELRKTIPLTAVVLI